jgi:uncharacterized protein (DUF58 family)
VAEAAPSPGDLERAARLLAVRSRREASSPFTGGYASAFRGGGLEFEESRPYAPGDDVRSLDWNATARTGVPYVKRFREERDQTLLLVLDVSASMGFASGERSKAATAAHAAALLAMAAARAGDRVGLLAWDTHARAELWPARGEAHLWRVIRTAVQTVPGAGGTDLAAALAHLRARTRRRGVLVLLSDFRDESLARGGAGGALAAAARRFDLVALGLEDRRELELVGAGPLRLRDAEHPGRTYVLHTRRGAAARYAAAAASRRRALADRLGRLGIDLVWLRSDRNPLPALVRFFAGRAGRVRVAP